MTPFSRVDAVYLSAIAVRSPSRSEPTSQTAGAEAADVVGLGTACEITKVSRR